MASVLVLLLSLAVVGAEEHAAAAAGENPNHQKGPEEGLAADLCEEMCQEAQHVGSCLTDCRVQTDVNTDAQDGVESMVEDQTVNVQGGEAMEKKFEATTNETVVSCIPEFEGQPTFEDVDADGSGTISADEAIVFGEKMCVPETMAMQIFTEADADFNKELSPEEWAHTGEDTELEQEVDAIADEKSEADDQHHEVSVPSFDDWDKNADGVLDADEMMEVLNFALKARGFDVEQEASLATSEEDLALLQEYVNEELDGLMTALDTNGDGVIDRAEFETESGGDMGDEMGEAQDADLDSASGDVNDPAAAVPAVPTEAPAGLFLRARHHAAKARHHHQRHGHAREARHHHQLRDHRPQRRLHRRPRKGLQVRKARTPRVVRRLHAARRAATRRQQSP